MSVATLYTGLHKRTVVATLDAEGTTVAHRKLPARPDSLALYFADLPAGPDGQHRAVAEATTGWYWVKDALAPLGVDLRLAHAKEVKAITGAKVKTDAHDARKLAQLLRVNLRGPRDQRRAPPPALSAPRRACVRRRTPYALMKSNRAS